MFIDFLLLLIVFFLCYQIYSVLGRTPADSNSPEKPRKTPSIKPPIITARAQIKKYIPSFDEHAFTLGATNAFEHIVKAFTEGNLTKLKPWLEPRLFRIYKANIEARAQKGLTYELAFFRHVATHIECTEVKAQQAFITVHFRSEQSLLLKKGTNILEGDKNITEVLEDAWVFSHSLKTSNAIWLLHKTVENSEQ